MKKGENSDQKTIGPLSQGRVRFKLSVQTLKMIYLKAIRALKNVK